MFKKKTLVALLALLGSAQLSVGQGNAPQSTTILPANTAPKGNGRITGSIVDGSNKQPVGFATITLNDAAGKPIDGTLCDEKGKFTLTKVASGNFKLVVSFIGYESQSVEVAVSNKDIALGSLTLNPSTTALKEVQVQGQRAMIEEKVDRTVYNAENDITNRGGDATDVLRKVPMLSVDLDGNVSMRGSSNLRVLINNRPSTITAGSVADALKQIPADLIKSVEVITSPSAKYDAEGSGGIINIVLKKNTLQGGTLGIDIGTGLRGSNLGLNGSYKKGKMGFSLGGFGRAGYNTTGSFANEQTSKNAVGQPTFTSSQSADTRNNNIFGRYSLGWDYDIDKNNFLTTSVQYGLRNGHSFQDDLLTQQRNATDGNATRSLRDVEVTDNSGTVDVNVNYTHTFEKPQQEFSILTQFSRNNRNNDFVNEIFNSDETTIASRLKNINESINQESTIQLDYQNPIGKNQLVEMGAKQIMRKVTSDYARFTSVGTGDYTLVPGAIASNVFNYNQNVTGGYLTYTLTTPSQFSFKPGIRYEYTTIDADFKSSIEQKAIPSYGILVPGINLSQRLKSGNTLKLSYNRRVQRPSIQFLNPNIQNSNPLNVTIGNPNLDPEYTNNFELGYNTYFKTTSLNFSTFIRNTNNSIQAIRDTEGNVITTSYDNIGQEDAYGFSVFGSVNISNKLTINGGTDTYYSVLKNNVPDPKFNASNKGWIYNIRGMYNYTIGNGWGIQGFGFYRGRQVQLQGTQSGFGIYSIGLRKDINEKKGSIGLGVENFLGTSIKMRNEFESLTLSQKNTNTMNNLSFRVNFSYRIGSISATNAPRRKKSVNNDDMKSGGDGGNDAAAAPAAGGAQGGGAPAGGGQGQGMRPAGGMPAGMTRPGQTPTQSQVTAPTTTPDSVYTGTPQNVTGRYTGKMGQFDLTLNLTSEGEKLTGTVVTPMGETPITDGKIKGNTVTFNAAMRGNLVPFTGKANGNNINLSVNFGGRQVEGVVTKAQ